jgi:hypothetical protein
LQEGNNQSVIRIENDKSSLATKVLPGSSVNVALPTAAVLICFLEDKLKFMQVQAT